MAGMPTAPATESRRRAGDVLLLVAGAVVTVAATYALVRRPLPAAAALLLVAAAAGCVIFRREIAAVRLGPLVASLALLLPMAALAGPSAALPAFPQFFAFRVLLLVVGALGIALLLMRPTASSLARWRLAVPLALWTAWLAITLLWAPDKAAGLRYLVVLATMLAVVAAAAAAGTSARRLKAFGVTMIVAFVLVVSVTVLEYRTGLHLPTSRLVTGGGSQTFAVTSVFHNQNDLATYLAICWPFVLAVPFFTRRLRWLALAVVAAGLGALAFVGTGSRSSLLAIGIATVATLLLLVRPAGWMRTRRAWLLGALLAAGLLVGAGYLLFNESESPMLRQFRLAELQQNIAASKGSGQIRANLYERGLAIAGRSLLLGAGPGQAVGIITSGTDALGIGDLHNWWLEIYVESGIPGLLLHLTFFFGLLLGLIRRARTAADTFVRYLAVSTAAALAGFLLGALGPSSSLGFAPLWTLYGLGLAILALPDGAADEDADGTGGATTGVRDVAVGVAPVALPEADA
jgi:teichuronic acid biosynthesis protein TuaE